MGLNRLMAAVGDAVKRGTIRAFRKPEQTFDGLTNDELQKRIELRDRTLAMAGGVDFKAFHEDAVQTIHNDTRDLLGMTTEDFSGPKGIEQRGLILGQEKVFKRITGIITQGNAAEEMLKKRRAERELREKKAHTNLQTAT